jgi:hypothetical protein
VDADAEIKDGTRRAARKTEAPQVIDRKALDAEIEALARAHAGAPDDLRKEYPSFYWNFVSAHVQPSIEYLKVTRMGRKWLASLRSTIFAAEHWQKL